MNKKMHKNNSKKCMKCMEFFLQAKNAMYERGLIVYF